MNLQAVIAVDMLSFGGAAVPMLRAVRYISMQVVGVRVWWSPYLSNSNSKHEALGLAMAVTYLAFACFTNRPSPQSEPWPTKHLSHLLDRGTWKNGSESLVVQEHLQYRCITLSKHYSTALTA